MTSYCLCCFPDVYVTSSDHHITLQRGQWPPAYRFRPPPAISLLQATAAAAGISHTFEGFSPKRKGSDLRSRLFVFLSLSLQVMSCLLQEQKVVLFSADWTRLTLMAESLLIFLKVSLKSNFRCVVYTVKSISVFNVTKIMFMKLTFFLHFIKLSPQILST